MNYSKLAVQNYHKIVTYHKIDVEMKCFWYIVLHPGTAFAIGRGTQQMPQ